MPKTVVALEATFNTSGAEGSVKSLKAQLKEAQAEVQGLSDKFGATSEQAVNAAKKAAELKDKIGDAKALTDAFNPDAKFKAFSSALQGVVGGFSALQGAQALFGSQSEDLQKTLAKVQGAMALSQGLNSVLEAKDAFMNLGAVLKTNVVGAFNGLKAAIGSTGIGLLVIAIPILIANFDKIKQVVANLFPGFAKLGSFIGNLINKITDFVGITSEAERATAKLVDANKKQIEATDQFLKFNADKYDEYTVRKIKANNDFKKNQNEIIEKYKDDAATQQRLIKEAREFANREIAKADDDRATKTKETNDKIAKDAKDANDKIIADNKRKNDEILAANQQLQDQRRSILEQEALKNISDEDERAKKKLEFDYIKAKEGIEQSKATDAEKFATLQVLYTQFIDNLNGVDETRKQKREDDADAELAKMIADVEAGNQILADNLLKQSADDELSFQERLAKITEREALVNDIKFASEEEKTAFEKENGDARTKIAEEEAAAKQRHFEQIGASLGQLSELIGKETVAGKAIAVAQATMDTYQAAVKSYNSLADIPIVGPALGAVAAGIAVASGIANVKKILAVKIPGGGGGGSAPSAASMPTAPVAPSVSTTTLNQGQVNQMANASARAFVLESDVSGNQERIQRLNRAARIN